MSQAEQTSERLIRSVDGSAAFIFAACSVLVLLPFILILGEKPASLLGAGLTLVLIPGAIWVCSAYRESIPYILIVTIYLGLFGIKIDLGGANLRPNMLVGLMSLPLIGLPLVWGASGRKSSWVLRCFLLANSVYLFSTLIHPGSAFFARGIADCVLFFVNVLQFALILWFFSGNRKAFQKAVQFLLYASAVYAAANILLFILADLGIGIFTDFLENFAGETGDFVRIINLGTTEGTYLAFNVVVLLGVLLISPESLGFTKKRVLVMMSLNSGALMLTFARGPWLAAAGAVGALVGLLVLRLPFGRLARAIWRLGLALLLLTLIGIVVLLVSVDMRQMVSDRVDAFSAVEVGTVSDRVQLWQNMWDDWLLSPWLGHGAHDYAKFRDDPTQISENFLLEFLHSSGLIGFSAFCFGFAFILLRGLRRLSSAEGIRQIPFGLPLLAGFVAMCVSSLSNPGMSGGFFWTGMGLLVCAEEFSPSAKLRRSLEAHGQGATTLPA